MSTQRSLSKFWDLTGRRICVGIFLSASLLLKTGVGVAAPVFTKLFDFRSDTGSGPGGLVEGSDGVFYGTTFSEGAHSAGTIFRVTSGGAFTKLVDMQVSTGRAPYGPLARGSDGNFYGGAYYGGTYDNGTLFRVTPDGTLTKLVDMENVTTGQWMGRGLVRGSDGAFYGLGPIGGVNGLGTIFKVTAGGAFTKLKDLSTETGTFPYGALVQGRDGLLYGMTRHSGATIDTFGYGAIFKITTDGTFTKLVDLNLNTGAEPFGNLVEGNDGLFYGVTSVGGANGMGTIFQITAGGTFAKLVDLNTDTGGSPYAGLARGNDGVFYGTTRLGGANGQGTIFKVTENGTISKLMDLNSSLTGQTPSDAFLLGSDGAFYGVNNSGGANGRGTIFKLDVGLGEAPTDISMSTDTLAEDAPVGTAIASFTATDASPGDTHTFTLVSGTGDTDNASFVITEGTVLRTSAGFDYETKSLLSIRVRATDSSGLTFEKRFLLGVKNVNEAPGDILLSVSSFTEDRGIFTIVGLFSTLIPDADDTHTFTLVPGAGSEDNAGFSITGSALRTAMMFDYETKSSHSIRVRVTDSANHTAEKAFTITVTDVTEGAAPTDITLHPNIVPENSPTGTPVGTLTATDPDPSDTHIFALVGGAGSEDNGSFSIAGNTVQTAAVFDYQSKHSLSIRVRATDSANNRFEKQLTIVVSVPGGGIFPPTDISLSPASVAENRPIGTSVGTFTAVDANAGDTHTFTLVSGSGSEDNGGFTITGNLLKTAAVFDRQIRSSYNIRVRVTDGLNNTYEEPITITITPVTGVNFPPADIGLSGGSVAENSASGTGVGAFYAADAGDSHVFTLVSGPGDGDNASFAIAGGMLRTAGVFDYEAKNSYSIRVRATDSANNTFEKTFAIVVNNVNEAPTSLALSPSNVAENTASGMLVGTLAVTDADAGDTHSFLLVSGAGSTDNANFTLAGNELKTAAGFDYEVKNTHAIRVRVTDSANNTFEKSFIVAISDVNDAPTGITLSGRSVAEHNPASTFVGTFGATDADAGDTHTFTLVSGAGSADNGSFTIGAGAQLRTTAVFDVATKATYSIHVRAQDAAGAAVEQTFTITITVVNVAPTLALGDPVGTTWIPRESNRNWFSVASSADGSKLVASVFGGPLYTSTDSGVTWTPRDSNRNWFSLASSADGSKLAAVVIGGQIYTSTDSGVTWVPRENSRNWSSIATSADGTKLVALAGAYSNGQIYTSTDSGVTWTARESSLPWYAAASSADGAKLMAAIGGGQIYTSTDSGTNWVARDSSRNWTSVASSADGTKLVAVTGGGQIHTSTDSGVTWTARETHRDWIAVASSADGNNLVAVDFGGGTTGGKVYVSTDAGVTWTSRESNRAWHGVASSADGKKLAATVANGQIYTSSGGLVSLTLNEDAGLQTVNLREISAGGSENQTLTVFATSSHPATIPHPSVTYTSPGTTGSLSFTPVPNASGVVTISVKVQDNGGTADGGVDAVTNTFTVAVSPANDAPTDIALSSASLGENQAAGTIVGTFTMQDPDAGDSATLTLVSGTGSDDNASFAIQGNALKTAAVFQLATKASYSIRVRATDSGGLFVEKPFVITVTPATAPVVIVPPASQTVVAGSNVVLGVTFSGSGPLVLQWRTNGVDLAGQTGPSLELPNVSYQQSGAYTVVISNSVGVVTSTPPALLTVTSSIFHPPAAHHPATLQAQGFTMNLLLEAGRSFRVQASTNLLTWTDLTNFTSTGMAFQFLDVAATNQVRRFYRVISP